MVEDLILASASDTRRDMLARTGLAFSQMTPRVDEEGIKDALLADQVPPRDLVDVLAEAKAQSISQVEPDALVIGSDQILLHQGKIFSKATTMADARETIRALRGDSHQLLSAVVLVRAGEALWRHIETVRLTMFDLTDAQIDAYLAQVGDAAFWSVGAYQIENVGAQLFEKIEGDFFSILGMPLIPLLAQLRRMGQKGLI